MHSNAAAHTGIRELEFSSVRTVQFMCCEKPYEIANSICRRTWSSTVPTQLLSALFLSCESNHQSVSTRPSNAAVATDAFTWRSLLLAQLRTTDAATTAPCLRAYVTSSRRTADNAAAAAAAAYFPGLLSTGSSSFQSGAHIFLACAGI